MGFYDRVNHTFSSIVQVTDQFLTTKNQKNLEKSSEISFAEILKEKQGLKFSKHAQCVWKTEISI